MPQMAVPKSSRGQGGPNEAPGSVLEAKSELPLSLNAKVILVDYYVFLMVGVTKPCKLQAKLLPHSDDVRAKGSRPLYQHHKNPYS